MPPTFRPAHQLRESEATRQAAIARRRDVRPWKAWYSLAIWGNTLRPSQLAKQPLCERCLAEDVVTLATVVHHKKAHEGSWALFVDPANLESVCQPHHDIDIQREEWAARRERPSEGRPEGVGGVRSSQSPRR